MLNLASRTGKKEGRKRPRTEIGHLGGRGGETARDTLG